MDASRGWGIGLVCTKKCADNNNNNNKNNAPVAANANSVGCLGVREVSKRLICLVSTPSLHFFPRGGALQPLSQ